MDVVTEAMQVVSGWRGQSRSVADDWLDGTTREGNIQKVEDFRVLWS